jgi:hypothetical protein
MKPPTTPPTMGAMLVEKPLPVGLDDWMDEPAGGVEVTTTVCTTTEPLDCVEVDWLVMMVGERLDTGVVVGVSGVVVVQDEP